MSRIFDKSFRYVPAVATDLRKTFERIRRQQRQAEKRNEIEAAAKVATFSKAKRTGGA